MSRHVESSRNNCALIGAIQTVLAIEGAVPIIHSTAGCGLQQHKGGSVVSGYHGSGYSGGLAIPSSNIVEKHVVFGGSSRLREQIKNSLKVIKGDLYVVLSGCATELVGDDIPAMTKEARDQGYPVICASTPGFRGAAHHGYQLAVKGIIDQLPKLFGAIGGKGGKIPGLVNIWGIIPNQDVFWQGNLVELQRILAEIGLEANTLFGFEQGLASWHRIPRAELNLVLSPWGVGIAEELEERYGTPWLDLKALPVGAEATGEMLEALTEKLQLDPARTEALRNREEKRLAHYFERAADAYFEFGLQKEFALIGDAGNVSGLAEFLVKSLGLIPGIIIVTDNPEPSGRDGLTGRLKALAPAFPPELLFAEDAGEIRDAIRRSGAELVLGSYLEREAAEALEVPLHQVSFPLVDTVVLGKSYLGYRGAVTFIEDLSKAILAP